jgi:outer membrane protein TolC
MFKNTIKNTFTALLTIWILFISSGAAAEPEMRLTISQAVEEAVANNPIITESDQYIKSAELTAKSARAALLPSAMAEYGYTGLKETPIMKTASSTLDAAHRHQYNWSVNVIQPLFTGFALTSRLKIAQLETNIQRLEKEQRVLDLTRDVKTACYSLLLAQKLLMVAEDEVAALTAHKKDAQLFFNQELIPKNDLLRSEVGLANSIQVLDDSRAAVEKARARLNRLLNRPLRQEIQISEVNDIPQLLVNYDLFARRAIEYRPVMQSVNLSLEALGFSEKIAKSGMYPEVSLSGGYMQEGDDPTASDNDFSNSHNAFVGISATWTFWDWGKIRSEAAAVNHASLALESGIDSRVNQIREEVRNAGLNCEVANQNITTASRALDQAHENWRLTNIQYQQQVATSTDVLDARMFLTRADTNYYNALYGYLSAIAELDRVVGKDVTKNL